MIGACKNQTAVGASVAGFGGSFGEERNHEDIVKCPGFAKLVKADEIVDDHIIKGMVGA